MSRWFDIGTALFAFAAALFWFASAYGSLPPIVTYWGQTPSADPFFEAVKFSARMNTVAAIFSGLSAATFAVKLFLFPT